MYRHCMHVERLDTEECEGLLDNERIFVAARVDGSNGCGWWDEGTGRLACGLRNYELTEPSAADNAGFRSWCESEDAAQDALRTFCEAHPDLVMMGQRRFMGAFKGHDRRAIPTFLIFDAFDRKGHPYHPDDEQQPLLEKAGLSPWIVQVLAVLGCPTMEDVLEAAKSNDFLLEGTGLVGEDAVLKMPGWRGRCGRQTYGKPVLDGFKKECSRPKEKPEEADIEQRIVELWLSDAELEKSIAKGCVRCSAERFDQSSRKMAGMLLSLGWHELLEECPNWVKRLKSSKVDFARLSGLCAARRRTSAGISWKASVCRFRQIERKWAAGAMAGHVAWRHGNAPLRSGAAAGPLHCPAGIAERVRL